MIKSTTLSISKFITFVITIARSFIFLILIENDNLILYITIMKKPSESKLIELIAKTLLKAVNQLDDIQEKVDINEDILYLLNEFINPKQPKQFKSDELLKHNENELVTFTEEFYQEICKHCGNRIDLMGIA